MRPLVLAHGGVESDPSDRDGPEAATRAGAQRLGEGAVEAVVAAVAWLEDDERFNAGTGSSLRFDGRTIEMDAGVCDSKGRFGAVNAIQMVRNPIRVARSLMDVPNNVVCGDGATLLARRLGHPEHDPYTTKAQRKWEELVAKIRRGEAKRGDNEWRMDDLRRFWNYERSLDEVLPDMPDGFVGAKASETVGAVAFDGEVYAAAGSTGGTATVLRSRIGDTATYGAGLYAGRHGAVACTGNGDHILRERLASRVHDWLGDGATAKEAGRRALDVFPDWVECGIIVLSSGSWWVGGCRDFAWGVAEAPAGRIA